MQLDELCQEIAPEVTAKVFVSGLSLSSKEIQPGEVFVALSGTQQHGFCYATQAVENGASAILFETSQVIRVEPSEFVVPVVEVEDLSQKLSALASRFYAQPAAQMKVCAVTGTNGKSSIAIGLAAMLQHQGQNAAMIGTVGYGRYDALTPASHTTPDAIALQKILLEFATQNISYVVMEASSHGLELGRMNAVPVHTAIYTNLSRDHQDFHPSMQAYARAKQRLFEMPGLRNAVIHANDAFGQELIENYQDHLQLTRFGIEIAHSGAYLSAEDLQQTPAGTQFTLASSWGELSLQLPWLGRFNVENCLAMIGGYLHLGGSFDALPELVVGLPDLHGRMQCFGGGNKPLVVVDYAHTPDALDKALQALREHMSDNAKLYCVFGCGGDRDEGKRPLMAQAVEKIADYSVVTDDNPRTESPEKIVADILKGFSEAAQVTVVHDRAQAIFAAIHSAKPGDMVLVAGKGHETTQTFADGSQPFNDCEQVEQALC